jgi:flagellar biosynthesis protein FliR
VSGELLFSVKVSVIFAVLIGLILSATEIGFQLGLRFQSSIDEPARSENTTIQGAILGLLALLLGFTFAMSISRYET